MSEQRIVPYALRESETNSAIFAPFFMLSLGAFACVIDNDGGDDAADSGGTPCDCPSGYVWAECTCNDDDQEIACSPGAASCTVFCIGNNGVKSYQTMSCENYSNEGTCGSWSPASNITLEEGVYVIDKGWIDGLLANLAPTWTCDSGYLDDLEGGKFVVANTSSGELLYELGLRNGDILYTINGITLDTVADGYDIYDEYRAGEDHFDIYLERDESYMTLCYSIEE